MFVILSMEKKKKEVRSIVLRGKRFAFKKSGNLKKLYGYCTSPLDTNRAIIIDKNLKGQQELDTIIHEMLHACFWDVGEDAIGEAASDIAKALWRMGFKKSE